MIVGLAFVANALSNFVVGLLAARFLGPSEFGRYAIGWAGAVLVNTVAFDWLRLSAVRFASERARAENPAVRATLEACFAAAAALVAPLALGILLVRLDLGLAPEVVAMAALTGVASGLFEFRTALARARFLDRLYARIVLAKNALGFVLTVGGAFVFRSAAIALAGTCLSVAGAMISAGRGLDDRRTGFSEARADEAARFAAYAAPFVLSSAALQLLPIANRVVLGWMFGYAEAGQFSLANDIGTRMLFAVASAMDVMLFRLAVRAAESGDLGAARRQVADNAALVLAAILPLAAGLWAASPSLEAAIAPPAYRGPFGPTLVAALPGLACFAILMYAVGPTFQIVHRTQTMIAAGLAACLGEAAVIALAPRLMLSGVGVAWAQTGGLATALVVAIVLAARQGAAAPPLKDLAAISSAAALMAAAALPLRALAPGPATLALQAAIGATVYAAALVALDAAGARIFARRLARRFLVSPCEGQLPPP
jgi:O-antigen/teichoic acid export membrane protein